MHTRAHDEKQRERRGDTLVLRDLPVFSPTLGVSGKCDVVEFRADPGGVPLQSEAGLWLPYPVEYKRGSPKTHDADRLQLCCQAMCLEEMLCCSVSEGSCSMGRHAGEMLWNSLQSCEIRFEVCFWRCISCPSVGQHQRSSHQRAVTPAQ